MNIFEIGLEKGNADTLKNIIENMLRQNVSDENIKKYTDCKQELIDEIKKTGRDL